MPIDIDLLSKLPNAIPEDLRSRISIFDNQVNLLIQEFITDLESQGAPPALFHYTNERGLCGIIQSGQLWCSDIFRQNDENELRHGIKVALDALRGRAATEKHTFSGFAHDLVGLNDVHPLERVAHYYICSLTGQDDNQYQWEKYGDNSEGFALGFDAPKLEVAFTRNNGEPIVSNSTFPITYGVAEVIRLHETILDWLGPILGPPQTRILANSSLDAYKEQVALSYSLAVAHLMIFFKTEKWRRESEYRFLQLFAVTNKPEVRTHPGPTGTGPIEHRQFDWRAIDPSCLSRIIIGPRADRERSEALARSLLQQYHPNPENVEVVHSSLRGRVVQPM